jgi:hypothetical protein
MEIEWARKKAPLAVQMGIIEEVLGALKVMGT